MISFPINSWIAPVVFLEELEKVAREWMASALLELLLP